MVPNWLRYALIELTRGKSDPPQTYVSLHEQCFAGVWNDGRSIVNWQGQNYVPQRLGIRARVHNWLVGI